MPDTRAAITSDNGSTLDATISVAQVAVFDITHRARTLDIAGLEEVLARLAAHSGNILGVSILGANGDTELELPYPIQLSGTGQAVTGIAQMARTALAASRSQPPYETRITVAEPTVTDPRRLTAVLATPVQRHHAEPSPKRSRRSMPTVRDLTAAGTLPLGSRLETTVRGQTWWVILVRPGVVELPGSGTEISLAQLTNDLQGSAQSAMRMWHVVRDNGKRVPLSLLRDELASTANEHTNR